jgi:hypothetical protein
MNAKKAKLLRRLAGVTSETQKSRSYQEVKATMRSKTAKDTIINPLTGEVSNVIVGKIQTATYVMNQSPRVLYKTLKKGMSL